MASTRPSPDFGPAPDRPLLPKLDDIGVLEWTIALAIGATRSELDSRLTSREWAELLDYYVTHEGRLPGQQRPLF